MRPYRTQLASCLRGLRLADEEDVTSTEPYARSSRVARLFLFNVPVPLAAAPVSLVWSDTPAGCTLPLEINPGGIPESSFRSPSGCRRCRTSFHQGRVIRNIRSAVDQAGGRYTDQWAMQLLRGPRLEGGKADIRLLPFTDPVDLLGPDVRFREQPGIVQHYRQLSRGVESPPRRRVFQVHDSTTRGSHDHLAC